MSDSQSQTPIKWPDPAWFDEFRRQSTPETMARASRYAAAYVADAMNRGIDPDGSGEDLVSAALVATLEGRARWRPDRVSLLGHICDLARVDVRNWHRRGRRSVPIHEVHEDHADRTTIETALTDERGAPSLERDTMLRQSARQVEAQLWRMAAGDEPLLRLLNALAEGATTPAEIQEITGLDDDALANARRRLLRLVQKLPTDLREEVRALLS